MEGISWLGRWEQIPQPVLKDGKYCYGSRLSPQDASSQVYCGNFLLSEKLAIAFSPAALGPHYDQTGDGISMAVNELFQVKSPHFIKNKLEVL